MGGEELLCLDLCRSLPRRGCKLLTYQSGYGTLLVEGCGGSAGDSYIDLHPIDLKRPPHHAHREQSLAELLVRSGCGRFGCRRIDLLTVRSVLRKTPMLGHRALGKDPACCVCTRMVQMVQSTYLKNLHARNTLPAC